MFRMLLAARPLRDPAIVDTGTEQGPATIRDDMMSRRHVGAVSVHVALMLGNF